MSKATRNYILLPLCLLLLNAVEEIVVYKLTKYPAIAKNPYLLTLSIILLFAVGFSLVGDMAIPYMRNILEKLHKGSKKHGHAGTIFFYILTAGLIFIIYFRIYTIGPASVLPAAWR